MHSRPRLGAHLALVSATLLLAILSSCNNGDSGKKPAQDTVPAVSKSITDASIPGNFTDPGKLRFDSTELESFLKAFPDFSGFREDLTKFYSGRGWSYAWYDDQGLIEASQDLYNRVGNMTDEGIPFTVPYYDRYKNMVDGADSTGSANGPDVRKELMITAQYFNYAKKVWSGLPPSATQKIEWYVPRKKLAYDRLLDSMLNAKSNGNAIKEPVYHQYGLLRDYLQRFRQLEKEGKWIAIPAQTRSFRMGDSAEVLAQVRKRLFYANDIAADNGSTVFDAQLDSGVRSFQRRFGLKEDGVIGPSMVRELSQPISQRIRQIIVNMERCRWIPDDPRGDYLVVNIPQFKLLVYASDTLAWSCNVVVGKDVNKTVIFSGDMKYVVFSPYWNVPPSIYNKEILPGMRRDPNYLAKHNMERTADGVREKPGPRNSLGQVKFLFPNSYNIYLHDTPSKSLFNEEKRTFSHGCIRVGEPKRLAVHLLRNEQAWDEAKIDRAMNAAKEQFVTLKNTVPVHIVYFTAWVDAAGKLNLRDDVYKRDARLADMIFEKNGKTAQ